jgi:hypothetical protein
MARFSLTFPGFSTSTSYKTVITADADATGEEFEVQELIMTGAGATAPADTAHRAALQRLDATGAGTGTAQTPARFDPLMGGASLLAGTVNYTSEPTTYQAVEVVLFGFNQRGGMRWAVPKGQGIKVSNTTGGRKAGVRVISSAAGTVDTTLVWEE